MQARYYDPVIGRFYSNDPVGYISENPVMSFNRYLYVNNNPYKYTDPTGQILEVIGSDKFKETITTEIDTLKSKPAGSNLVSTIEKSEITTIVLETKGGHITIGSSGGTNGNPGKPTIGINPDKTTINGKEAPLFVAVAHELGHAAEIISGTATPPDQKSHDYKTPGTTPADEQGALNTENAVRSEHGLEKRNSYF
jgi:uncharacterized protein RhaS with RHS repeats